MCTWDYQNKEAMYLILLKLKHQYNFIIWTLRNQNIPISFSRTNWFSKTNCFSLWQSIHNKIISQHKLYVRIVTIIPTTSFNLGS
jgi:hypothetical protein